MSIDLHIPSTESQRERIKIEEESKFVPSQFEPRHKRWVNFYPNASNRHATKEDADAVRGEDCIACVEVDFTEGQGL